MPRPAGDTESWVALINDAGTIAGSTWSWGPNDELISARAFTARTDGTQLRILPPAVEEEPHIDIRGMNDTGQLVGCAYAVTPGAHAPGPCRAYYYDARSGTATDAHAFYRGRYRSSEAIDITDDRVMLLVLSDGTILLYDIPALETTIIPAPPGGPEGCVPVAMSDGPGRFVVGNCERDDFAYQAWIHDRTTGETNTIPVPAGHHTVLASDVNSSGTVAVTLIRAGGTSACTPRSPTGRPPASSPASRCPVRRSPARARSTTTGPSSASPSPRSSRPSLWDPDTRQSTYLDGLDFIPGGSPR